LSKPTTSTPRGGVKYKRKSFSTTGDELAELLEIPSKEERERKAIELATRKWMASISRLLRAPRRPSFQSPLHVVSEQERSRQSG
jgi:hypothetical protein